MQGVTKTLDIKDRCHDRKQQKNGKEEGGAERSQRFQNEVKEA
jgi:hypothetical protein